MVSEVVYFIIFGGEFSFAFDDLYKPIYDIINDGASAYKGIIPTDRWHEPYMSMTELQTQIG